MHLGIITDGTDAGIRVRMDPIIVNLHRLSVKPLLIMAGPSLPSGTLAATLPITALWHTGRTSAHRMQHMAVNSMHGLRRTACSTWR